MSYIREAQLRARRRKSPWNLVVVAIWFPLTLFLCWGAIRIGWYVHLLAYPEHARYWNVLAHEKHTDIVRWLAGMLVMFGPVVPNLIAAAFVTNTIVHSVPPARRALDREAGAHRGTDFEAIQRSFLAHLPRAALLGYGAWIVGALIPFRLP